MVVVVHLTLINQPPVFFLRLLCGTYFSGEMELHLREAKEKTAPTTVGGSNELPFICTAMTIRERFAVFHRRCLFFLFPLPLTLRLGTVMIAGYEDEDETVLYIVSPPV